MKTEYVYLKMLRHGSGPRNNTPIKPMRGRNENSPILLVPIINFITKVNEIKKLC